MNFPPPPRSIIWEVSGIGVLLVVLFAPLVAIMTLLYEGQFKELRRLRQIELRGLPTQAIVISKNSEYLAQIHSYSHSVSAKLIGRRENQIANFNVTVDEYNGAEIGGVVQATCIPGKSDVCVYGSVQASLSEFWRTWTPIDLVCGIVVFCLVVFFTRRVVIEATVLRFGVPVAAVIVGKPTWKRGWRVKYKFSINSRYYRGQGWTDRYSDKAEFDRSSVRVLYVPSFPSFNLMLTDLTFFRLR